jgi:hypothetical protein
VVCRNALWVNRLWSAIYPGPLMGRRAQSPPCPPACRQDDLIPRIGPPRGTLMVFPAHRSLEGDPHVVHSFDLINLLVCQIVNFGLYGPKTGSPSTLRGRLTSARMPHSRSPKGTIICLSQTTHAPLPLPVRTFGELSAPLVQKRVTRGPPTPVHIR